MLQRLLGRTAVVTASTDGIGRAIAHRLASEGARVVVSSRKEANVKACVADFRAEGLDVQGIACHVGQEKDRRQLLDFTTDTYGTPSILVSNAAANPFYGPLVECPESAWDKIFDTNVKAAFMLCQTFAPVLREAVNPSITFVSSIAAYRALEGLGAYSVSKSALLGLNGVLATELAPEIRVNTVCPGIIRTKFSEALWKEGPAKDKVETETPLRRVGEVDDIAPAVAYLASDDASYVTGESLVIGGGMHAYRL